MGLSMEMERSETRQINRCNKIVGQGNHGLLATVSGYVTHNLDYSAMNTRTNGAVQCSAVGMKLMLQHAVDESWLYFGGKITKPHFMNGWRIYNNSHLDA